VVEWTGLENRQARKGLVGSNPTSSVFCKSVLFAVEARMSLRVVARISGRGQRGGALCFDGSSIAAGRVSWLFLAKDELGGKRDGTESADGQETPAGSAALIGIEAIGEEQSDSDTECDARPGNQTELGKRQSSVNHLGTPCEAEVAPRAGWKQQMQYRLADEVNRRGDEVEATLEERGGG
jgi:hypothetical protein